MKKGEKNGIEKFTNIMDDQTCIDLINFLEDNIENAAECHHGQNYENVECKQLILATGSDLDEAVRKSMFKITDKYADMYPWFGCSSDSGYQLRKITNKTLCHVDNIFTNCVNNRHKLRIISVIIGLNSDYENGTVHFPYQKYKTTIKRGEALAFPVYFNYPHFVDKPTNGFRYTINTWFFENSRCDMLG
jgi:hypothetical protein|tara:strand:- start:701 stop:1270 length:570 start_codon:yes stop_codon:yes gene_type:complete